MKKKEDFTNIEILLEGLDPNDINSILSKWKDIVEVRKKMDELEDMLKSKIRAFLKERRWERYADPETKISVSLSTIEKETFDRKQLRLMLTNQQYAQVVIKSSFEKLNIITPEARERMKQYGKQGIKA